MVLLLTWGKIIEGCEARVLQNFVWLLERILKNLVLLWFCKVKHLLIQWLNLIAQPLVVLLQWTSDCLFLILCLHCLYCFFSQVFFVTSNRGELAGHLLHCRFFFMDDDFRHRAHQVLRLNQGIQCCVHHTWRDHAVVRSGLPWWADMWCWLIINEGYHVLV